MSRRLALTVEANGRGVVLGAQPRKNGTVIKAVPRDLEQGTGKKQR